MERASSTTWRRTSGSSRLDSISSVASRTLRSLVGSSIERNGTDVSLPTPERLTLPGEWPSPRPEVAGWVAVNLGVFLLDDHEVVRTGLRALLEASDDIEVVGEAGTVAEALARIPATRPDVAILDVRLPDGSGVEVCREIRSSNPGDRLRHADVLCRRRGALRLDHGGCGRLRPQAGGQHRPRRRDPARRAGQSLLDPALTERVLERLRDGPQEDPRWPASPPRSGGSSI